MANRGERGHQGQLGSPPNSPTIALISGESVGISVEYVPELHTRGCVYVQIVQPRNATPRHLRTPSHEKGIFHQHHSIYSIHGLHIVIQLIIVFALGAPNVKHITRVSNNVGFSATVYNQRCERRCNQRHTYFHSSSFATFQAADKYLKILFFLKSSY